MLIMVHCIFASILKSEWYIHTYIHKLYFSSNLRVAIIKANISEKTITKVTKYTTTLLTTILYNIYKLWLKEIELYIKKKFKSTSRTAGQQHKD